MISNPMIAITTPIIAMMKSPVRTPAIRITAPMTAVIAPAMRMRQPMSIRFSWRVYLAAKGTLLRVSVGFPSSVWLLVYSFSNPTIGGLSALRFRLAGRFSQLLCMLF